MKSQLEIITELVETYHAGQFRRDGKPYKTHLDFVSEYVYEHRYAVLSQQSWKALFIPEKMDMIQAAAMGHDLLEDTDITEEIMIFHGVHPTVINWIKQLSRKKGESYFDFIMRLREPAVVAIKLADLHHNSTDNAKEGSLLDKYRFAEYHLKQLVKNNYNLTL